MRLFLDNAPWITLDEVNSALPPENMPEAGQINVSYVFQSETDYLYYTTHATDGIGGYSDGEGLTGGITTAYDDDGTYSIGVNLDEDQGWGMQTVWEGSWNVNVYDVPPGATMNSQLLEDHETVRVMLTSPFDVSNADTAAGFRVSLSPTYAGLAQTYSSADPWPTEGDPLADFNIESSPSGTFYGRIFDWNGGFSDYATTYVLPTVNTPIITDTSVQLCWLDVAEGESSWIVQRALYGGSFSTVAALDPNSTSFLDQTLTPGTRYQWRVRAAGTPGTAEDTAWSAKRAVTTIAPPSNLKLTFNAEGTLTIDWSDQSSNEHGYQIQESEDNEDFSTIATVNPDVTTYTIGAQTEPTCYYRVVGIYNTLLSEPAVSAVAITVSGTEGNDMIQLRVDPNDAQSIMWNCDNIDNGAWSVPVLMTSGSTFEVDAGLGSDLIKIQSLPAALAGSKVTVNGYQPRNLSWNAVGDYDGEHFGNDVVEIGGLASDGGIGNLDNFPSTIDFDGGDPFHADTIELLAGDPYYHDGGADGIRIRDNDNAAGAIWNIGGNQIQRQRASIGTVIVNAVDELDDNEGEGQPLGLELFNGSGVDQVTLTDVPQSDVDAGAGNDVINIHGGDYGGMPRVGHTHILGGADDDEINVGTVTHNLDGIDNLYIEGESGADTVTVDDHTYNGSLSLGSDPQYQMNGVSFAARAYNGDYTFGTIERWNLYPQEDIVARENTPADVLIASTPAGMPVYVYPVGDRFRLDVVGTASGAPVHVRTWNVTQLTVNVGGNSQQPGTLILDANPQSQSRTLSVYEANILPNGIIPLSNVYYDTATFTTLNMYRSTDYFFGTVDVDYVNFYANTFRDYLMEGSAIVDTVVGCEGTREYLWHGSHADNVVFGDPAGTHPGDWLGSGITSNRAARDYAHNIGTEQNPVYDRRIGRNGWCATAVGWRAYGTNGVHLLYSWCADADLDRDVDAADLGRLSAHWQQTVWSGSSGWSDVWYNGDFTLYTVYETSTSNDNPITNPSLWFVDIDDLYLLNCNWHRYASDLAAWQ